MICAGIDAGSRTLKIVLRRTPIVSGRWPRGWSIRASIRTALRADLLEKLLHEQGLRRDDVGAVVATGYGRKLVRTADTTVTEITCQARGVRHRVPDARTIVDIGGQDSKLVRLKAGGAVADFVMNDRCAAGTGRFLEMLAAQLGTPFCELESLVGRSRAPAVISSMCVVFAESEIVGLLAAGVLPEDIVTGVQTAIATRIAAMTGRKLAEPILFTGGVALVPGMGDALAGRVGKARADRPPAAIDLRPRRGPPGRRSVSRRTEFIPFSSRSNGVIAVRQARHDRSSFRRIRRTGSRHVTKGLAIHASRRTAARIAMALRTFLLHPGSCHECSFTRADRRPWTTPCPSLGCRVFRRSEARITRPAEPW